ncbi:MAG: HAD family phosphatase [Lachnospiraceae bacterium]|nr:HAD family phosphatase [Lachnospiraceae bacterium]
MNIIFDMDGLMFDTERVFIMAWDYAGEKIGIGKAGYMVYKTLGMNIASSYKVWKEEFGDGYNQEELRKYTKEFLTNYYNENKVPVKKGLYNLLDFLQKNDCKMAVASSSPRWEVEKHLKDAGIYEYFKGIICGDMVENSKPDPEIYLKACALLEANPSECYALEDSKNGLLAAHRAGCRPIMVPDLWQPDEDILKIIDGKYEDLDEVKVAFESKMFTDIN